jgi:hypothetical protein
VSEKNLQGASNEALQALYDIEGVCQLIRDEQTVGDADFPQPIAAAISMIHIRAAAAARLLEVAV